MLAIAAEPGSSNQQIAARAGIADAGQASRLLRRLEAQRLAVDAAGNSGSGYARQWHLSEGGRRAVRALRDALEVGTAGA